MGRTILLPDQQKPVGFILSLEGADSLVNIDLIWKKHMDMD